MFALSQAAARASWSHLGGAVGTKVDLVVRLDAGNAVVDFVVEHNAVGVGEDLVVRPGAFEVWVDLVGIDARVDGVDLS